MTNKLKMAIKELKIAGKEFIKRNPEQDDGNLYVEIVGKSWDNYLKAGGSLTMLNK